MDKTCDTCKYIKNTSEFNKNRAKKDGLNSICRECSKARSKRYYRENHKTHIKNVKINSKKYHSKLRGDIDKIKSVGCRFCDEKTPCCMDFHHLDPTIKDKEVSKLIANCSRKKVFEEINKCILVCTNCHRKIHAGLIVFDPLRIK